MCCLGYRSVQLKNGNSEELELATLLVHVERRVIGVGTHTDTHTETHTRLTPILTPRLTLTLTPRLTPTLTPRLTTNQTRNYQFGVCVELVEGGGDDRGITLENHHLRL